VDDLALSSTDPAELQAMITFVQRWSERSRLLINADKTKIMAFHENKKHRKLRERLTPSFYLYSSFPSASRVELKVVEEFEYLGLCLDSKLLMHGAVSLILKKASKAHQCVAACAYSLRYGRTHCNPNASESASEMLTLWKSAVLPHFTLYLRYLPLASQIHSLQKQLNSSLRRSLRVYGHDTALLADTGILPLRLVQHIQLSQLCYRLRSLQPNPFPLQLFRMGTSTWWAKLPLSSLECRMLKSIGFLDHARLSASSILPPSVIQACPRNKESPTAFSFRNWRPSSGGRN